MFVRIRSIGLSLFLVAAAAIALGTLESCYFSLTDLFAESSAVTDRVKDTGARSLATLPSGIESAPAASFLVVGDPHFGASWAAGSDVLDGFASLAKARNPAFVMYAGDDADGGTESQFKSFSDWASTVVDSGGSQIPWFSAVGNHDLYNGGWTYFRTYIGPSFYHLNVAGFTIYVIDTGQGTLGNYQISRLRSEFAADPNPKIVVSHYPIYGGASVLYYYRLANPREQAELLELFAQSKVKLIIAGHYHYLVHENVGAFDEWLVESLTVKDGGSTHCFSITLKNDGTVSLSRIAF
ncbi:MAG TPA: metallophosphoesterase [Rectinemataceae bacterium]|nr:metallophosphoesterase [Rectinemataceae bacterium]